ncbi:nucleoside deaminase [Proteiniclasticum sp. SCR006]|uniref:Nucleoside deaminase n=1 Tax=Proteiniclasticum aestuarii TaxID=2817862 RepID=A0A939H969_9CLOT|nr:nucleoside deaminase [Proteiniclasticum aestuarii]MBO1264844.1 nucleoside deaminase [Proteiniclasticum aestuarii]
MPKHEEFMIEAIRLSVSAVENGNEPFGAVLVKDGEAVYSNENQIFTKTDPTYHGELGLIRSFCQETGITDLSEYVMYSSCEPCFMCSGAMVWSNLGTLYYAASNMDLEEIMGKEGVKCSEIVFTHSHHQPEVHAGLLREESMEVLSAYFGKSQSE